jgi:hypothetical protein
VFKRKGGARAFGQNWVTLKYRGGEAGQVSASRSKEVSRRTHFNGYIRKVVSLYRIYNFGLYKKKIEKKKRKKKYVLIF